MRSIAAILALFLSACGVAAPDDAPLLDQLGFSQPATGHVRLWNSYHTHSGLQSNRDAHLTAALVEAGQVRIEGENERSPSWRFAVEGGAREIAFTFGTRRILERTEIRTWNVGSTECFAETISYTIDPTPSFANAGLAAIGPFQYRLVAANDPAVGHWQAGGTMCGTGDELARQTSSALDRLADFGATLIPRLSQRIEAAQGDSSVRAERDLAAQGLLARSSADSNVLVSRVNQLAWYTALVALDGRTFADLDAICRGVRSGAASSWRVPSEQEMRTLVWGEGRGVAGSLRFIDTPDRRLLGHVAPVGRGERRFWTNAWTPYVNNLNIMSVLNHHDNGYAGWDTEFARRREERTLTAGDRILCVANYQPT